MEKEKTGVNWKKFFHFLEEILTLGFTVVGVLLSDWISNNNLKNATLNFSTTHIIIAVVISIMTYGAMYSDFRYEEEKKKPPFLKRAGNAIMQGVAWRTFTNISS